MSDNQMVLDPWDDERMARAGVELAEREERLERVKKEKAAAVKVYNGDIGELEESISQLAAEIRRQKASRSTGGESESGEPEDVVDGEEVAGELPPASLPDATSEEWDQP